MCSVYIPPRTSLCTGDLEILYQDLPKPCLIAGDFNAHSYLWGNSADDTRGNTIESFMQEKTTCASGMMIAPHIYILLLAP